MEEDKHQIRQAPLAAYLLSYRGIKRREAVLLGKPLIIQDFHTVSDRRGMLHRERLALSEQQRKVSKVRKQDRLMNKVEDLLLWRIQENKRMTLIIQSGKILSIIKVKKSNKLLMLNNLPEVLLQSHRAALTMQMLANQNNRSVAVQHVQHLKI